MTDDTRTPATDQPGTTMTADRNDTVISWLENEFPGWQVSIDETATWEGDSRPLWIARRGGHHPQSELSAAKLHTRLTEYLEREARKRALSN
ncbi:hypothetical protein [Egicoccus halophilus]|uniref:Uncharacterized protein n=1 Tax=Egicoccus halophilus TaxID=1670830 RepID=A0A8J3ETJ2_9ACTN|nr:hypothetical protein [Egicoccus halophilus]GGI09737.1 hypothetical protein GCM10011354_35560 [Egicoccus halophilus]